MELRWAKLKEGGEVLFMEEEWKTWKELWSLYIPGKVRHFIWRAYNEALPTHQNLMKRKIIEDSRCAICQRDPKTITHILWECPFANGVWASVKGKIQKCSLSSVEFWQVTRVLLSTLSREDMEAWAILSWAIWNAWNAFIHNGIKPNPSLVFEKGITLIWKFSSS